MAVSDGRDGTHGAEIDSQQAAKAIEVRRRSGKGLHTNLRSPEPKNIQLDN
ncbi:MAG: hypothetical protein H8E09_00540 [Gammaproteobacteria bacterium]|nr:hypothetical protein [Gammaproteobacteria bacterium]